MTPDLRFTVRNAGPLDLRLRVARNGDTCVENRGPVAPTLAVSDPFGEAMYELAAGQHVLFEHGSLHEVVDHETSPCGCPPRPPHPPSPTPSSPQAQRASSAHPNPPKPKPSPPPPLHPSKPPSSKPPAPPSKPPNRILSPKPSAKASRRRRKSRPSPPTHPTCRSPTHSSITPSNPRWPPSRHHPHHRKIKAAPHQGRRQVLTHAAVRRRHAAAARPCPPCRRILPAPLREVIPLTCSFFPPRGE